MLVCNHTVSKRNLGVCLVEFALASAIRQPQRYEVRMPWQYTKRSDGKIAVTLDNNVWDFLFLRDIVLASELPAPAFAISITREVEIETGAIPADISKAALKAYIDRTIASCDIRTTSVFGFASEGSGPQRVGGFGQGTWQSQTEREFYAAISARYLVGRGQTRSQLSKNEGDAAVAARSFFSIALTCESPRKSGPLRFAAENGGKILYLEGFEKSGMPLRAYVEAFYQRI
jgi:hypothetical protein